MARKRVAIGSCDGLSSRKMSQPGKATWKVARISECDKRACGTPAGAARARSRRLRRVPEAAGETEGGESLCPTFHWQPRPLLPHHIPLGSATLK